MAECRHARPQEREQTHQLWRKVFGDEPQAQEAFYDLCAPQGPLVLVEGSYSLHPRLRARYDLRIFLTCSREEQTARLTAREGENFPSFRDRWVPLEERYRLACRPEADSLLVDTTGFFS